ncbi:IS3 family transposase [Rahnella sp. CG8]|uniref:IS3 family transposase n=1 Tax=Rahnella sp. CG8 TaxID=2726078 RepID=UPI0020343118|nr:IS3 family transposase [Rahnella sp. CG8]
MYSYEDRIRAVRLYIRLGKRTAATLRQLGYPTKNALKSWYREYEQSHHLPTCYLRSRLQYTTEQKKVAVDHYLTYGCSLVGTRRALGYPCSEVLRGWIDELHPGRHRMLTSAKKHGTDFELDQKRQAVRDLCMRGASAREIAQNIGVSRQVLYKWKDELLGGEAYQNMRKRNESPPEDERDALLDEVAKLKQQIRRLQLERDILTKAGELIKKGLGISALTLTNREKTKVVDALKEGYPLAELLDVIQLARSCYFYHKAGLHLSDKYADTRAIMTEIFHRNYRCYGYRRIHAMLRQNETPISEKVVRRLMAEEQLVVSRSRRRRYSSYCGEIGPAPENLLARNFNASSPNEKWLTDITEFQLPAGKVWLSPVVDCFDGKVVSWSIGTRPNAQLANTMLDGAISTLTGDDRPIIHSDRGGHYRWPGWLKRIQVSGLVRSMSRKGCSPDNAACEGFFGRLKNEMYYGRDWSGITLEGFMNNVDTYIRWYNERRIKRRCGPKLGLFSTDNDNSSTVS